MKKSIAIFFIAAIAVLASSLWAMPSEPTIKALPRIYYVAFQSLNSENPLTVAAQFRLPWRKGKIPAVVIVHDTEGVNGTGNYYAKTLNNNGIATLEIDMRTPRGLMGLVAGRPKSVPETLPDAYGAFKYLSSRSEIDAQRIGIMGFSFSGVVSMLTATTLTLRSILRMNSSSPPMFPFIRYTGSTIMSLVTNSSLSLARLFLSKLERRMSMMGPILVPGLCKAYQRPPRSSSRSNSIPMQPTNGTVCSLPLRIMIPLLTRVRAER